MIQYDLRKILIYETIDLYFRGVLLSLKLPFLDFRESITITIDNFLNSVPNECIISDFHICIWIVLSILFIHVVFSSYPFDCLTWSSIFRLGMDFDSSVKSRLNSQLSVFYTTDSQSTLLNFKRSFWTELWWAMNTVVACPIEWHMFFWMQYCIIELQYYIIELQYCIIFVVKKYFCKFSFL